ncbi:hypothetical protein J6590_063694 [Homalodisca vitripennis]|nr:hypothetical protein J6590_063694 [Homalodisca vitripennis]
MAYILQRSLCSPGANNPLYVPVRVMNRMIADDHFVSGDREHVDPQMLKWTPVKVSISSQQLLAEANSTLTSTL